MTDKEVIKTAHKLHYISWSNIAKKVITRIKDKNASQFWRGVFLRYIKSEIIQLLFGDIKIRGYCFGCQGARMLCKNCFLNLGISCNDRDSFYGKILNSKTYSEALPYIKKIRDAKINVNLTPAQEKHIAHNLRTVIEEINTHV